VASASRRSIGIVRLWHPLARLMCPALPTPVSSPCRTHREKAVPAPSTDRSAPLQAVSGRNAACVAPFPHCTVGGFARHRWPWTGIPGLGSRGSCDEVRARLPGTGEGGAIILRADTSSTVAVLLIRGWRASEGQFNAVPPHLAAIL
jgi:hypothetical protein